MPHSRGGNTEGNQENKVWRNKYTEGIGRKKKLIIIETAKVRELNQEKERGRAGKNNTRIRTR